MTYPNTDWPGSIDIPQTRTNNVDVVYANDFNYPDEQILSIQDWLGDGQSDFIGDTGIAADGPGGIVSPIADGGTAFTIAAKEDYATGKLLSVGDDYDGSYSEKFFIGATGILDVSGVTDYETLVTGDDHIPNKKYTDDAIAAAVAVEDLWDRAGTVLFPKTSGDTILVGDGLVSAPGMAFKSEATSGWYWNSAGIFSATCGGTRSLVISGSGAYSSQTGGFYLKRLAGDAAAPTYTYQGRQGVGWYSGAAESLSASVATTGAPGAGYRVANITSVTPGTDPGELKIYHTNITEPSHGIGDVGYLTFSGVTEAEAPIDYVRIIGAAENVDPGQGSIMFQVASSGSLTSMWYMTSGSFRSVATGGGYMKKVAGSASAPVWAFTSWYGAGMYAEAPNDLGISLAKTGTPLSGYRALGLTAVSPGDDPGELKIYHTNSLSTGDRTGDTSYLTFIGYSDTTPDEVEYARIAGYAIDDTEDSESGAIDFHTSISGGLVHSVRISAYVITGPNDNSWGEPHIYLGDGSDAGNPTYAFRDRTNYGMYCGDSTVNFTINGTRELEISSTGVSVSAGGYEVISTECATPGTDPGELKIYHTDLSTPHSVGDVAYLTFSGVDVAKNPQDYAQIRARADVMTDGNEEGRLKFYLPSPSSGALTNYWEMTQASLQSLSTRGVSMKRSAGTAASPAFTLVGYTGHGMWVDSVSKELAFSAAADGNDGAGVKMAGIVTSGVDAPSQLRIYDTDQDKDSTGDVAHLTFSGFNDAAGPVDYARIVGGATAVGAGSEQGSLDFDLAVSGTPATMFVLYTSAFRSVTTGGGYLKKLAGTAASPALTFTNYTTNGLFSNADGYVGVGIGGNLGADFLDAKVETTPTTTTFTVATDTITISGGTMDFDDFKVGDIIHVSGATAGGGANNGDWTIQTINSSTSVTVVEDIVQAESAGGITLRGNTPTDLRVYDTSSEDESHIGDVAYLSFMGYDSGENAITYGRVLARALDDTLGAADAATQICSVHNGSLAVDCTFYQEQVRSNTGSAAAPSLSFIAHGDLGLYDAGSNAMGMAAGGVRVASISEGGHAGYPGWYDEVQTVDSSGNATALDMADGFITYQLLDENTTYGTPSNPDDGMILTVIVKQAPDTQAWTVAFNGSYILAGGAYTMTSTFGSVDVLRFVYVNTLSLWVEISRAQKM